MDREQILELLTALGRDLHERGLMGDLYVVGGAAITLCYDARRSTRDIDGVFVPKTELYAAAARLARERALPAGWLNDAVKGFLLGPDQFATEILDLPGLRVEVASPQVVLVMKALAHRIGEDDEDVRLLAGLCGLDEARQVLDLVEQVAGTALLTAQVQFFVEAVLDPEARDGQGRRGGL